MEPRWTGSYNLILVYQEFLLLLIALIGGLACLSALASLLFVWRECAGFSGSAADRFRPISAEAAPSRASSQADFSTCIRLTPDDSLVVVRDAGTKEIYPVEVELR